MQVASVFSAERKIADSVEQRRFHLLHARCARKIGRLIQRLLGTDDEVDDLIQEVLVTILTKIDTLRDPEVFDAWVVQVTKNKVRNIMRQRSYRRQKLAAWRANQDPTFQADLDGRVIASRAMDTLERLSPSERALLVEHWFTPGKVDDLAASRGYSVPTLRR